MSSLINWVEATRPRTLPAALIPVLLASSMATVDGCFNWIATVICLSFAVSIQVGTNFANDYLDGVKGADKKRSLGPRRAVGSGLISPSKMKKAAILSLSVGFCIGLGLIPFGGWWLLIVGVASVACAWLYTGGPYPLAYHGLGDVFVVFFFGFVAAGFTYYVQAKTFSWQVLLLGLSSGLLINNLLLINNYRDADEDRTVKKNTLVVILGRNFALVQYFASLFVPGMVVLVFWFNGYGPFILLALFPLAYGIILRQRLQTANTIYDFSGVLKDYSAKVVLGYGLLFSAGLLMKPIIS